jgi:hypothetical protein
VLLQLHSASSVQDVEDAQRLRLYMRAGCCQPVQKSLPLLVMKPAALLGCRGRGRLNAPLTTLQRCGSQKEDYGRSGCRRDAARTSAAPTTAISPLRSKRTCIGSSIDRRLRSCRAVQVMPEAHASQEEALVGRLERLHTSGGTSVRDRKPPVVPGDRDRIGFEQLSASCLSRAVAFMP